MECPQPSTSQKGRANRKVPTANPQSIAVGNCFGIPRAESSLGSGGGLLTRNLLFWVLTALLIPFWFGLANGSASNQPDAEPSQDNAPSVIKVEPPSWWAKHTINPVRLLVRGKNLQGARVRSSNPALQTSAILVNRSGTYLFVNVSINQGVRPGSYPLTLVTATGTATIPFTIEEP